MTIHSASTESLECAKVRYDLLCDKGIKNVVCSVAAALRHLHENKVCHADIKRKNVMRQKKGNKKTWRLIDMDAAVEMGKQTSFKYSECCIPPEYMQVLLPERTTGHELF